MQNYIPYIVSILCAFISGYTSYAVAIKKARSDINIIVKQHQVDMEALEKQHQMELEKINLEHSHQLELQQKDLEKTFGASFLNEVFKNPEVQRQITSGMRKGYKK